MEKYYEIDIAGLKRKLPLCPINEELYIGAFIMFSDVELTVKCAEELIKFAPEHDIVVTAESKGIPIAYEFARQAGEKYIVARKAPKLYMRNVISTKDASITTKGEQTLCFGQDEIDMIKGKRVLIVDDVISTGGSLKAIENIVNLAGGNIVGKLAVLAEGEARYRDDIKFLAPLPMFNKDGKIIED